MNRKRFRKIRGKYTQKQLSDLLGLSPKCGWIHISKIETGKANPSTQIIKLMEMLEANELPDVYFKDILKEN